MRQRNLIVTLALGALLSGPLAETLAAAGRGGSNRTSKPNGSVRQADRGNRSAPKRDVGKRDVNVGKRDVNVSKRDVNVNKRDINVNRRDVNVNRRDVDVDIDVDRRHGWGHGDVDVDVDIDRHGWGRDIDVDIDVNRRHHHGAGAFVAGMVVGAAIASLPPRHTTVVYSGANYYYSDGYFYQPSGSQYVIVQPPIGAAVAYLPSGYAVQVIGGVQYYSLGGVYYRPVYQGSTVTYIVSRP